MCLSGSATTAGGRRTVHRSQAYNRGARFVDADVVVFAEADMLVPYSQIRQAVAMAAAAPGLVVRSSSTATSHPKTPAWSARTTSSPAIASRNHHGQR